MLLITSETKYRGSIPSLFFFSAGTGRLSSTCGSQNRPGVFALARNAQSTKMSWLHALLNRVAVIGWVTEAERGAFCETGRAPKLRSTVRLFSAWPRSRSIRGARIKICYRRWIVHLSTMTSYCRWSWWRFYCFTGIPIYIQRTEYWCFRYPGPLLLLGWTSKSPTPAFFARNGTHGQKMRVREFSVA